MSDNKKYYYLKLKENFFDQDHIKYLEGMTNGYIYSNILLKLYLKAIKHDGRLMITEGIPYDPTNLEPLAKVIGHDPSHVCDAVNFAVDFKLIKIIDMKEMYITDIQNFIGHSSTEADRVRNYRKKLKESTQNSDNLPEKPDKDKGVQMYDKSTPELDIELEKEIELDIKKDIKKKFDINEYLDNKNIQGEFRTSLIDYYEHRNEIKKKITERGLNMLIKKLSAHPAEIAIQALEDSIAGGYQGVFPQNVKKGGNQSFNRQDKEDLQGAFDWAKKMDEKDKNNGTKSINGNDNQAFLTEKVGNEGHNNSRMD